MRLNFSKIWVFVFFLLIGVCATSNATNPVGLSQPSGLQASLSGSDVALSWTAGTATAGQTLSSGNTSCAIDNSGAAWCWGPSYDGELGNGSTASATTGTPTQVVGGHVFSQISTGDRGSCAIDTDGAAWCWGNSYDGRLGNGSTANNQHTGTPSQVLGNHVFRQISVGSTTSCAIDTDGDAWCWGDSYNGKLGNGSTATANTGTPSQVVGGHVFSDVSVGTQTVCALDTDGAAWCWGTSYNGRLGNGSTAEGANTGTPSQVVGNHVFDQISVGYYNTCAIDTNGAAWCWGASNDGILGNGSIASDQHTGTPTQVVGSHAFIVLERGGHYSGMSAERHRCGIDTSRAAWCWGGSYDGALGNGSTASDQHTGTPIQVVGSHQMDQLSTHPYGTCAIDTGGAAWCWGSSNDGRLGNGSTESGANTGTPSQVVGNHTFYTSADFVVSGYRVEHSSDNGSTWTLLTENTQDTGTSYSASGLIIGEAYLFRVAALNALGESNFVTSATSVTPVGAALTPTFGSPTSTADGFTVQISNYSTDYTWGNSTTAGAVSISSSGLITVTGLASGQSTTLTITTTRAGYNSDSAQISGSAIADSDGDGVNDNGDSFPFADTEATSGDVALETIPPTANSSCSIDSLTVADVDTESPRVAVNGIGKGISFALSGCDTSSLETLAIKIDLGTAPAQGAVAMKIDSDGNWSQIEGATIEGSLVTYTITDNGPLDEDSDLGEIGDPVTVAVPYTAPALPVTTLPGLPLAALSLLLGLFGYRRLTQ
jgi:alpha-tubulin suppressor-like RCC1 family protein